MIVDIDENVEALDKLEESYQQLSSNWNVDELKNDVEEARQRFDALKVQTDEMNKHFDAINACYEYMMPILETLAWTQEMLVVVEIEAEINTEDDIKNEIDKLEV